MQTACNITIPRPKGANNNRHGYRKSRGLKCREATSFFSDISIERRLGHVGRFHSSNSQQQHPLNWPRTYCSLLRIELVGTKNPGTASILREYLDPSYECRTWMVDGSCMFSCHDSSNCTIIGYSINVGHLAHRNWVAYSLHRSKDTVGRAGSTTTLFELREN